MTSQTRFCQFPGWRIRETWEYPHEQRDASCSRELKPTLCSRHEFVLLSASRLEDKKKNSVPAAEPSPAVSTVEPKALLFIAPLGIFFNVEPSHVAHGHAPTVLTHVMHQTRHFESFLAHQLLNTRGSISGLVQVPSAHSERMSSVSSSPPSEAPFVRVACAVAHTDAFHGVHFKPSCAAVSQVVSFVRSLLSPCTLFCCR